MKRVLALLVIVAIIITGFFVLNRTENSSKITGNSHDTLPSDDRMPAEKTPAEKRDFPPMQRSPMADKLNDPHGSINEDIKIVENIIQRYQLLLNGNPVGSNIEITKALTGNNAKKLAPLPADHPAINERGELTDRWGTPFFFHQHSSTDMEVVSAGEDQKMWTEDDVKIPNKRDAKPPRHLQKR